MKWVSGRVYRVSEGEDDKWVSSKIEKKCNGMGLGYDDEDDEWDRWWEMDMILVSVWKVYNVWKRE